MSHWAIFFANAENQPAGGQKKKPPGGAPYAPLRHSEGQISTEMAVKWSLVALGRSPVAKGGRIFSLGWFFAKSTKVLQAGWGAKIAHIGGFHIGPIRHSDGQISPEIAVKWPLVALGRSPVAQGGRVVALAWFFAFSFAYRFLPRTAHEVNKQPGGYVLYIHDDSFHLLQEVYQSKDLVELTPYLLVFVVFNAELIVITYGSV